jgi:hypothetical protein
LVDVSARPDDVTLLCHQSQDPANKKGKKTFALVTLDLNRATLVGWFSLGGERRDQWVGPMFFGYHDDEWPVSVGTGGCSAFTDGAHSVLETVDLHEQPEHVIVIARRDSATKGEVWFVGSRAADVPRMVFTNAITPTKATRCGDVLYVTEEAPPQITPSR